MLGRELNDCFAAIVVGRDPSAAAALALGIATVQSKRRRVAVCDLVGDVPPLQRLVKEDDPHGIVDSFQYGVSLNKIAYQVGATGNLFIMPSGTEPVVDESIIRSDRWRRLSGGFREVGALLLLVANADAAGLEDLIKTTDGLIVAGENPTALGPVIGAAKLPDSFGVSEPHRVEPATVGTTPTDAAREANALPAGDTSGVQDAEAGALPAESPSARPISRASVHMERRAAPRRPDTAWLIPVVSTVVVLGIIGGWWATRDRAATLPNVPDSAIVHPDSLADMDLAAPLGDSLESSGYGVEIVKLNTQSGAILKLHDAQGKLPAVTYSPVVLGMEQSRWFTVIAGAYRTKAAADSALGSLRERKLIEEDVGAVVHLPYALVLQPEVSRETASAVVKAYLARGLPAYALLQEDGTARVYAGAFDSPEQAAILAASVSAAGIEPMVAYRMGRTF